MDSKKVKAIVMGLTPSHVLAHFDVPNCAYDSSCDTYACSPTALIYTLYLAHEDSSSLSNVFVSNTHSYAYVAFSITTPFSTLYSSSCLLRDNRLYSLYNTPLH